MWSPATGQRVRFHSKLNDSIVLAAAPTGYPTCSAHYVQDGPAPEATLFEVEVDGDGLFQLFLRNVPGEADFQLMWYWPPGHGGSCMLAPNSLIDYGDDMRFRMDPLGDPWFALNNFNGRRVVDLFGSETYRGAEINAWTWNGGDNQWWRAELA